MLRCWSKIAPRLRAEAEQLMKVLPVVRPLMLGCGPRECALRNNTIVFSSLSLSLLSAIHRLMLSKQALMRQMESGASAMFKGQIELNAVGVELDTKAVLSRDRHNAWVPSKQ